MCGWVGGTKLHGISLKTSYIQSPLASLSAEPTTISSLCSVLPLSPSFSFLDIPPSQTAVREGTSIASGLWALDAYLPDNRVQILMVQMGEKTLGGEIAEDLCFE